MGFVGVHKDIGSRPAFGLQFCVVTSCRLPVGETADCQSALRRWSRHGHWKCQPPSPRQNQRRRGGWRETGARNGPYGLRRGQGCVRSRSIGNLTGLLDKIQPAVEAVRDVPGERNSKNSRFVEAVSEAHVRLTVARIRELSPVLRDLESAGKIQITGCIYDLKTGRVRFLR